MPGGGNVVAGNVVDVVVVVVGTVVEVDVVVDDVVVEVGVVVGAAFRYSAQ